MENQKRSIFLLSSLLFLLLTVSGTQLVQGSSHHHHHHHHHHLRNQNRQQTNAKFTKLFVFGDSYADTGNNRKGAGSWSVPYGITFPGKPSGRYSDGRVLTDYLASYMRIKSPVPYKYRKTGKEALRYGMNFAYGGTGVFDTLVPEPNMTAQIGFFQNLLINGVYTRTDVESSVALVSLAGNDYGAYYARNGTAQGLPAFITTVVNQLSVDIKRIRDLGVRKVIVTSLQPLGCLPQSTYLSSFQNCNQTQNTAVNFHNQLLQAAVAKFNNNSKESSFAMLDLYNAFLSAFKSQGEQPGSLKFENPLKPCCLGTSNRYFCGDVDQRGVKQYTICQNPKTAFFWDTAHPTQQGWLAVYSALRDSLNRMYY